MMHSLGSDLLVMWVAAIVLVFAFLFFGALSLQDRETYIVSFGGIAVALIGAIVVTIGQLVGWIGVW